MNSGKQDATVMRIQTSDNIEDLLTTLNYYSFTVQSSPVTYTNTICTDNMLMVWSQDKNPLPVATINDLAKHQALYLIVLRRFIWADNLQLHVSLVTKNMLMKQSDLSSAQIDKMFTKSTELSYWNNGTVYKIQTPVLRSVTASDPISGSSLHTESAFEFYMKQRNLNMLLQ